MSFKQFEIWLADLNPRFGTESGKARPVLIVQNDLLNKVHPSAIVCPITTNVNSHVNILRVNLAKKEAGLNKPSAIMIDQIRAIDNKRLIKKLGKLSVAHQQKVLDNVKIVLDIN